MARAGFDAAFPGAKNQPDVPRRGAGRRAPRSPPLPAASADAKLHTDAEYVKTATSSTNALLAILYVLLGFSIVVSLFGMVNTMVLSVFERTREIGMLRTLGLTRRQARRMIRHESIITALIGATLGLGLGVFARRRDHAGGAGPGRSRSRGSSLADVHAGRVLAGVGRGGHARRAAPRGSTS